MGIYSNNSTTLNNDSVIANEAYSTSYGALEMMIEAQQNDLKLFEHTIGYDFQESALALTNDNSFTESMELLNESGIKSLWASAVLLIDKIMSKIKAILDNFIGKLDLLFTNDTSKLLKKYKSQFGVNDLSTMVIKGYKPIKDLNAVSLSNILDLVDTDTTAEISLDTFLGSSINEGPISKENYDKAVENSMFDESTDKAGIVETSNERSWIITVLETKDIIKEIKSTKDSALKILNTIKKQAKMNEQKEYKDNGIDSKEFTLAHNVTKNINTASAAVTRATNAKIKYIKKAIAQSKKALIMGANYTPKKESVFLNAMGDCVMEEVLEFFD